MVYASIEGSKELINSLIGYRGELARQIASSGINIHRDQDHPIVKEYWKVIDKIEEVREDVLSMGNV